MSKEDIQQKLKEEIDTVFIVKLIIKLYLPKNSKE